MYYNFSFICLIFYREINWAVPNITFPLFVQLLGMPTYTRSILLGLTVSVGGLTESLVSSSAFLQLRKFSNILVPVKYMYQERYLGKAALVMDVADYKTKVNTIIMLSDICTYEVLKGDIVPK